jgi:type I restriction enzyme, R subunit
MTNVTESTVEEAALNWFRTLQYDVKSGVEVSPDGPDAERSNYNDVILIGRLKNIIEKINPKIPLEAKEEALKKILRTENQNLFVNNRTFHKMLTDGIDVEFSVDGSIKHDKVWIFDYQNPDNNDWLVVNQFTVVENANRRPDIVVFINGIPIALIELKNVADEKASIIHAYHQIQTYKKDIPSIYVYNEILIISDGIQAKVGTLTADRDRFMPWRKIGEDKDSQVDLKTMVDEIFRKDRVLDILHNFIVFETDGNDIVKKMAGYHQYHAVNNAVESTIHTSSPTGDKKVGVIWHTQGSGKSLTMIMYAAKIIKHKKMENPTIIVITDRNDLDDQLFDAFSKDEELLRQKPVQAKNRVDLRDKLDIASGGVVFSTIQKFAPQKGERSTVISKRRNIVIIVDEAHRSQYDLIDGFAGYIREALPNASFVGFTGTPLESGDKNTRAIFGDYLSVYDIHQAVEDNFTVRIYYEGRLAKLSLDEEEKINIDQEFEEITEDQEEKAKQKIKSKWARVEAIVGSEKRLKEIAQDMVNHFERRLDAMDGKGIIVCMSRRICIDLYDQIIKLRPNWDENDDKKGTVKVIMTGSPSDPLRYQSHVRNKDRREAIKLRLKNPKDPLKIVIVRDMWLTGFDAPILHTMYIDKPMQGHNLMQAIARVNRVLGEKQGGLIVDYIGIAFFLKKALSNYSHADQEQEGIPIEKAVALLIEKYEIVKSILHGFDYSKFFSDNPSDKLTAIAGAMGHILKQEDGKKRFLSVVTSLVKTFSLTGAHDEAMKIKDEVLFFTTVKANFVKHTVTEEEVKEGSEEIDLAMRQLVSKATMPVGVIDLLASYGVKSPDVSVLSEDFLSEMQNMKHKNMAIELLNRIIRNEIKTRSKRNIVQTKTFTYMLQEAIKKYENRTIEAAQILAELLKLAKEMRDAYKRGEKLKLTDDEIAFYDALEVNDSAVKILGDETLQQIARELILSIKQNVTTDWSIRENVRAKMRLAVKKILRKYGYPPDKQEKATHTILEQAEEIAKDWTESN